MKSASTTGRNIRNEIVDRRKARIAMEGYGLGVMVPEVRLGPVVPFCRQPLVICEIKRRSPSRGAIAPGMDPVAQAQLYRDAGINSVSILTEEDYFGGSLADLMAVKSAFPELAILRKDFLVDEYDVQLSWQAGADAILLIASMLDFETLAAMHAKAISLGMSVLVEVHTRAEIEKIRPLAPPLVGINCRNLENFQIDRLMPLGLRPAIDWNAAVVFESGIFSYEDALYTSFHGFQGILVGEAVVRRPQVVSDLIRGVSGPGPGAGLPLGHRPKPPFWQIIANAIAQRAESGNRLPLVKICGITCREDAEAAVRVGADLLGFVFAPSPRQADPELLRELADLVIPKVAVVVGEPPAEVLALLAEGLIDAVQFSGDETPPQCAGLAWPWYKALRVANLDALQALDEWRSPRVLLDAWSAEAYGGTGKRLDASVAAAAASRTRLWMAGGIGPDNIKGIIRDLKPELVDLSSSLEAAPGRKDPAKLAAFFAAVAASAVHHQ